MLNELPSKEKIFQLISGHFKVNSGPPNIEQQREHLLHEYELDDETLQKAQLEQHKIFQNFPPALLWLPQVLLLLLQRAPNRKSSQLKDKMTLIMTLPRLTILSLMTMISL